MLLKHTENYAGDPSNFHALVGCIRRACFGHVELTVHDMQKE